jgi:4-diphosphocytidyl-2-C-methyl-D-erythritol kinase
MARAGRVPQPQTAGQFGSTQPPFSRSKPHSPTRSGLHRAPMTDWIGDAARVSTPAKVNLCLSIVGRRIDGYHWLDSIVAPIGLFDDVVIRITPSAALRVSLRSEPPGAAPDGDQNLAVRAADLFLRRVGIAAHVAITLTKCIPAGAGLGGGSSNAAGVLRCLNALLDRPVRHDDLTAWAVELGADVPLFLVGRPARMRGIGELLEPVDVEMEGALVVAFAGTGLDTRTVYAKYDDLLTMSGRPSSIRALTSSRQPLRNMLHNDLEAAAFQVQPALRSLKERLCTLGAAGASMTGSGSAVFGWWQSWNDAAVAAEQLRATGVWAHVARVLEQIPAVELVVR